MAPVFNKGRFSAQAPKPYWRLAGLGSLTPMPGGSEWAEGRVEEYVGAQPPQGPSSGIRMAGGVMALSLRP